MKTKKDKNNNGSRQEYIKVYQCKHCLKIFYEKDKVKQHIHDVHKERKNKDKIQKTPKKASLISQTISSLKDHPQSEVVISLSKLKLKPKADTNNVPTEKSEVTSLPPSLKNRDIRIAVKHEPVNEITVSTPEKGFRELLYCGIQKDVSIDKDSGEKKVVTKYREWRCHKFPAIKRNVTLPRDDGISDASFDSVKQEVKIEDEPNDTNEPEKSLVVSIPSAYPDVFNIFGMKDDMHSIFDILTGQGMSTPILDAYIKLRVDHFNNKRSMNGQTARGSEANSYVFKSLSVHFLPIFDRDQCSKSFKPNMSFFSEFSFDKNTILIAPLYTCKHFYLSVFNFRLKTVNVYDSCWHFVPMDLRFQQVTQMVKFLIAPSRDELSMVVPSSPKKKPNKWNITFIEHCAQQIDEFSCGCYVIRFAENEMRGKLHKNTESLMKSDVMQIRRKIISQLLPTTDVGRQVLEAISE